MNALSSLEDIERLYATHGALHYGEGVSQMEHALQCAALAQAAGATPSLIVAALLHDIGHLFEEEDKVMGAVVDYRHQVSGAEALAGLFGEAVRGPIALHVAAKRYLCFTEPSYFDALSRASRASLELQGGPFDAAQAASFEGLAYWREAIALRRFDDEGKREDAAAQSFNDFAPLMHDLLIADAPRT
jgi:phosphonate degradation associated HDIG domain protein